MTTFTNNSYYLLVSIHREESPSAPTTFSAAPTLPYTSTVHTAAGLLVSAWQGSRAEDPSSIETAPHGR